MINKSNLFIYEATEIYENKKYIHLMKVFYTRNDRLSVGPARLIALITTLKRQTLEAITHRVEVFFCSIRKVAIIRCGCALN